MQLPGETRDNSIGAVPPGRAGGTNESRGRDSKH
jgi:hypothetical protein